MNQLATNPNQTLLFEQLCDRNDPIYLQNTLQHSQIAPDVIGDIIIGLHDHRSNRNLTLGIPKNSCVCANDQVPSSLLKDNTDIRKYLRNGALRVLTQEQYTELCTKDANFEEKSNRELNRLLRNINGDTTITQGKLAKPVIETEDLNIRTGLMGCMNKSQFEQEDELTLLEDFKAMEPFSEIEKEWMRGQLSTVAGSYQNIKTYLQNL